MRACRSYFRKRPHVQMPSSGSTFQTETPNPMRTSNTLRRLRLLLVPLCGLGMLSSAAAQSTTAAPSASELSKYDANKNGVLDPSELAAQQTDQDKSRAAVSTIPGAPGESNGVTTMSPFEVTPDNEGYMAMTSAAGTRLNSRLEDIPSSISVLTKQQLEDTAAVDINDIFLTEIGTEGTGQFTDPTNDGRGEGVWDNVAGNPTGANRMRGLAAAQIAVGGFTASSSIPIDTYNLDAVEISRGPNSSLAGLSEGGGTVNLVTARANLTREITSLQARVNSYGGWRASADISRPLLRDKLALRFAAVYEEVGYVRKPSLERNDRQTFSLTFRPFPKTTINASIERFSQFANRANSITPRDAVTPWFARGRPTYDPITRTYQVNGVRSAPITNINQLPLGISGIGSNNVRIQQYVDNGDILFMSRGNAPTNTIVGTNALTQVVVSTGATEGRPLYRIRGLTDQSLYDWEEINISASGISTNKGTVANARLDQSILNTSRNKTDLELAWRREDQKTYQRQYIGQLDGVGTTLTIDASEKMLDGSPNPFVGRPFIGGGQPQSFRRPVFTDSYRAQLAHQLDLRKESNLLKWVGLHRAVGYAEHITHFSNGNGYRYTDIVVDNPNLNAPLTGTQTSRIRNESRNYVRFYMGDAVGGNVDYANPGPVNFTGQGTVRFLGATAPAWTSESVTIAEKYFAVTGQKRKTNTSGANLQSFVLNDHLVTTFGWREDRVFTSQQQNIPFEAGGTGFFDESYVFDRGFYGRDKKWRSGKTEMKGAVLKPFRMLPFLRDERRSGLPGILAQAVRGLQFHYNESNSFRPVDVAYNVYLEELRNPQAETEEYGFAISVDNKFAMRLTHHDTMQIDKRGGTGVLGGRALSLDIERPEGGSRPFDLYTEFLNAGYTQAQAAQQMQIPLERVQGVLEGKPIDDSSNSRAKGWELELQFNPTRHWTIKATGTKQEAIDSGVSVHIQRYIEERMPVWTSIRLPDGNLWWTTLDGSDSPSTFFARDVKQPLDLAIATQGKKKPQTREYAGSIITNYRLAGIAGDRKWLRGVEVGGTMRYAGKRAVGYYAAAPDPDGVERRFDPLRPIFDKAETNFDLSMSYRTRLFKDRIAARFQLNVRNVNESGRLRGEAVNPDGQYYLYRIIDPRQFIFTTTFDL